LAEGDIVGERVGATEGQVVGLAVGDLVGLGILFEISNESVCPLKSAVPCRFDRKDIEGGKFSEVMLR
jgi:hypothetical protein